MIEIHVIGGAGGSLRRVPTRSLREAYAAKVAYVEDSAVKKKTAQLISIIWMLAQ